MTRVRSAAGGRRVVEVERGRIVGWLGRFGVRNGGITAVTGSLSTVTVTAANGSTACLTVPFAPMAIGDAEPVEALLRHLRAIGPIGAILVRGGAYSIGVCRDEEVLTSSTDTRYVQARTAAGGWSQQRYARRRSNQRRDAHRAAADTAHRLLARADMRALVVAGEQNAIREVLDDPRLRALTTLPRRVFGDIAEPRRAVLDEVARRSLSVEITVTDVERPAENGSGSGDR